VRLHESLKFVVRSRRRCFTQKPGKLDAKLQVCGHAGLMV
jgi:hypothetical protein